jgi:transketolase
MGVGMAIAERFLSETFNREGLKVVDHRTYALISDGDLMEGVSAEAASLAATMGLGKLVYLYDANRISLEGGTELSFTEDVAARFRSYGWEVRDVADGNDLGAIETALRASLVDRGRPHLVMVHTHIGYGSPKQDTKDAHGEPLGAAATRATKERLGWPTEPAFLVPPEVREHLGEALQRGSRWETDWDELMVQLHERFPEAHASFVRALKGELPPGWADTLPLFFPADGEVATRDASAKMLNLLASRIPTLLGGSADLAPSTKTHLQGAGSFLGGKVGRNLHFGVREHAMGAALNGMAMHGGVLPFGSTFLVFCDYLRPSLRLGAIMGAHEIYIFTHDSLAVGEDGPTHQPVEHLWSLRGIPGVTLFRPADANETVAAWKAGLPRRGPVLFAFSRQKLPVLDVERFPIGTGVPRGGYILQEAPRAPAAVILATGSEVHLALRAQAELAQRDIPTRVVSVPSVELFREQSEEYRDRVLPPELPVLAVEAGSPLGWWRWVGPRGDVLGVERFGASAPGPVVLEKFGFTPDALAARVERLVRGPTRSDSVPVRSRLP